MAPMNENRLSWQRLKSIAKWSPVSDLPFDYIELGEGIVKVGECQYLRYSKYSNAFFQITPGGPFVFSVLWAVDDSAAERCFLERIERDLLLIKQPPNELLFNDDCDNYSKILQYMKANNISGAGESACYRRHDGIFLYSEIQSVVMNYYFRSKKMYSTEVPFAIESLL